MISIVIPTYNEEKYLERTLATLSNQTLQREKYEIIIVDGGSKDRTIEIARKYADKVMVQKAGGVPAARNEGVEAAKFDLIATTDADTIVPRDWLEKIVRWFSKDDIIAVCGVDGPIEKTTKAVLLFKFLRTLLTVSSKLNYYCLGGCNSAFRKEVFLKLGGYRNLPHSDDVDLGLRMRKAGKIIFDRSLMVEISIRRLEKHGYLKVLWTWFKGEIQLLLGRDLRETDYFKQQY